MNSFEKSWQFFFNLPDAAFAILPSIHKVYLIRFIWSPDTLFLLRDAWYPLQMYELFL